MAVKRKRSARFEIRVRSRGHRTDNWVVFIDETGTHLGHVMWHGRWRRYIFFADTLTSLDDNLMWDIADFVAKQNAEREEKRSATTKASR